MDTNGVTELVNRFDYALRLARASELARSGRLLEAETLISEEQGVRESFAGIDLLARIYVKHGKYGEALRLWRKLSHMDHGTNSADQCIQSLTAFAESELNRRKLALILLAAAWVVAFMTTLVFGILHWIK